MFLSHLEFPLFLISIRILRANWFRSMCMLFINSHKLTRFHNSCWPFGSRLWCLTVSLSLSHWYSWSGVVLDCIDSWSLHPYILCIRLNLSPIHWYNVIVFSYSGPSGILISGMQHHLVDLHHDCSNYVPQTLVVICLRWVYIQKT